MGKMTREEAIREDKARMESIQEKCKYCGEVVLYPEGIRLRGDIIAHMACFKRERAKREEQG